MCSHADYSQIALQKRNALIAKIMEQYDQGAGGEAMPVVSLEDFFDQNWDEHSLAPNIAGDVRPPLRECYRTLLEIRNRPNVQDVLVGIHETPYADDPDDFDIWPDSDTLYVITTATEDEVSTWVSALKPNEVGGGELGIKPFRPPKLLPGMAVYAVWWD